MNKDEILLRLQAEGFIYIDEDESWFEVESPSLDEQPDESHFYATLTIYDNRVQVQGWAEHSNYGDDAVRSTHVSTQAHDELQALLKKALPDSVQVQ